MNGSREGLSALFRYKGGIAGEAYSDVRMDDPLCVIFGAGHVIPGIEKALSEMDIGETRTVIIPPSEGYGDYDPEGVRVYSRTILPQECWGIGEGEFVAWRNPASGMYIPVCVVEATAEAVKLDFNHPFAGKTLEYWLELVDLRR